MFHTLYSKTTIKILHLGIPVNILWSSEIILLLVLLEYLPGGRTQITSVYIYRMLTFTSKVLKCILRLIYIRVLANVC